MVTTRTSIDQRHIRYIARCFSLLPHQYTAQESNHISLANFTIASFDLTGSLPNHEARKSLINWIYLHLVSSGRGFRGSLNVALPIDGQGQGNAYDPAYLPATYFAISTLLLLDDDLSRLNIGSILAELKDVQMEDGSFTSTTLYKDVDLRFSYLAVAVRYMITTVRENSSSDSSGPDLVAAERYLCNCRNFDGGFGQVPKAESHAGLTFCALAALHLLGASFNGEENSRTLKWLVDRQNADGGFNGRQGKESDVCYCFWTVSSLAILGKADLIDRDACEAYLAECVTLIGGYGKIVGDMPDIYHTYLGLAVGRVLDDPDPLLSALSLPRHAIEGRTKHLVDGRISSEIEKE